VSSPRCSDGLSLSSDELCKNDSSKGKEPILEIQSESEDDMVNDVSSEEDPVEPPSKKTKRRHYDRTRRYHIEWSAKHAWAVPFIDDSHHYVKCAICTTMDGRPCIMMPKIDTLQKHEGQRKVRELPLFLPFL
jgi:hypothetical protein